MGHRSNNRELILVHPGSIPLELLLSIRPNCRRGNISQRQGTFQPKLIAFRGAARRAAAHWGRIAVKSVIVITSLGFAGVFSVPWAFADTTDAGTAAPQLPQVIVIGNAPLEGFGLPLNQIPSNVQTASGADLKRQQSLDVVDYLNNNFSGVTVSESDGNPFQIDVYYHGFTASPLLGTPEGLSVYVDGVRVNESFGDTVNWDLIPESAIKSVSLFSGSNPVFGLNTLGGALALRTKNGHDDPGTEVEVYYGSYSRKAVEVETGGSIGGGFDYYFNGNFFDEHGWRNVDNSKLWRSFAKVGWQDDATRFDLSYTYADNFLYGDGPTPLSLLAYDRKQTYTPDYTQNIMNFVNLAGTHTLAEHLLLSGNVFYRYLNTYVLNGNINDFYLEGNYAGPPTDCTDSGANAATLAYCTPGQNATSTTLQSSVGFGLQLTEGDDVLGMKNQAILGVDYVDSHDDFNQAFQYGGLSYPDHLLIYEPSPYNNFNVIGVSGNNKIFGAYLTDTLSPNGLIHLTGAVRYNLSSETINGYSIDPDPGDYGNGFLGSTPVTGDHTFVRINPSVGFTVTPTNYTTYYADYNVASRTPTVIELGCANPAVPCGLPDDFASDPNLKQVVARTFEVGLRGNLPDESFNWSADAFHTVAANDIQFIATATNSGYFDNVGSTRRQGVDIAFGGKEFGLNWKIAYSYVEATFESTFVVNASSNSLADANGNIVVQPGDRLPLVPLHTARLMLDYDFDTHLNIGANVIFASGSYLHGNENNANVAGTTNVASGNYISPDGTGWIPSYATLNFNATYRFNQNFEIFARVSNVLNKDYYTAGFLTQNVYNPNGTFRANPNDWTNENAVVPGAPREVWGGLRARF
jgi:outer membrane receptor protein involved in Fe transport